MANTWSRSLRNVQNQMACLCLCVLGERGGQHTCKAGFFYTQVHMKEGDVAYSVGFTHSSKQTFKNSKKFVWEVEYVAFCSFSR